MVQLVEKMARREVPPPPVAQLIGFDIKSLVKGRAVFEFEAGPQHANPMGGLHGGILCDVADAAMGVAYASTLAEGEPFGTVELKINFLRPFKTGKVVAEGWVVSGGKNLGWTECEVRDEAGRLIAKAGSTCMTLRPDAPTAEQMVMANGGA
jgi:uncharacterized protein (TIGR00369 family)